MRNDASAEKNQQDIKYKKRLKIFW